MPKIISFKIRFNIKGLNIILLLAHFTVNYKALNLSSYDIDF